jgi:hypothetical protein
MSMVTRADAEAMLDRWERGEIGPLGVKHWLAEAEPGGDPLLAELLAELDLLEVYLLTAEDVPALRALLAATDLDEALAGWAGHRDAIDLDARSRALKKDRFYRPFCR